MNVGTGFYSHQNAYESGKQAIQQALHHGSIETPDLVLAFCSGEVDAQAFYQGMRSTLGDSTPIIGGSALGIITNDHLAYEGPTVGVAALQLDDTWLRVAVARDIDQDEHQAGKNVGQLLSNGETGNVLLMFYDSVKSPPTPQTPPVMNSSPPIIAGIETKLHADIPIVGAGVLGDYDFHPTHQFCGFSVEQQSLVGVLFGGNLEPYVKIMHGCMPKDGIYYTITRIDGPIIYEVDGRPIVEVINEIYGDENWQTQLPVRRLSLGVNYGDKFDDFHEESVVTRLIVGVLPQGEGIILFEPDFEVGKEILFMLRDGQMMIDSAQQNARELMQHIARVGHTPRLALYIDCAGRTSIISDTLTEEAAEIQDVMNEYQVPLLGFYSGVEIAPMLGSSRGLDWTGVLLVLAER